MPGNDFRFGLYNFGATVGMVVQYLSFGLARGCRGELTGSGVSFYENDW